MPNLLESTQSKYCRFSPEHPDIVCYQPNFSLRPYKDDQHILVYNPLDVAVKVVDNEDAEEVLAHCNDPEQFIEMDGHVREKLDEPFDKETLSAVEGKEFAAKLKKDLGTSSPTRTKPPQRSFYDWFKTNRK